MEGKRKFVSEQATLFSEVSKAVQKILRKVTTTTAAYNAKRNHEQKHYKEKINDLERKLKTTEDQWKNREGRSVDLEKIHCL